MRTKRTIKRIGFSLLFVVMGLCWQPVDAPCVELQPIKVELESCTPSFSGMESVCLTSTFRLSNPNKQMVSVTMDYILSRKGKSLGGGQMPSVYVPAGESVQQRDHIVVVYNLWFIREIFSGNNPKDTMEAILPLWKGMGGQEIPRLPEGLWSKIPAITSPTMADGSMTLHSKDGKEKIFFFKIVKEELE
jgi:hypothetical protein